MAIPSAYLGAGYNFPYLLSKCRQPELVNQVVYTQLLKVFTVFGANEEIIVIANSEFLAESLEVGDECAVILNDGISILFFKFGVSFFDFAEKFQELIAQLVIIYDIPAGSLNRFLIREVSHHSEEITGR